MEATTGSRLFSEVVYHLRFELITCFCVVLGWFVASLAKHRTQNALAQKKNAELYSTHTREAAESNHRPISKVPHVSKQGSGSTTVPAGYVLSGYRRPNKPEDVLRLFERHRRSQFLMKQTPETLQEIFTEVYNATIRVGLARHLPQYIQEALRLGVVHSEAQVESIMKMCTSKKVFNEALLAYDLIASASSSGPSWSCLLLCAVEVGQFSRCAAFFENLKAIRSPSYEDYFNMIRFVVKTKEFSMFTLLLKEMRTADPLPDAIFYNKVLAVCISQDELGMAEQMLEEMRTFEVPVSTLMPLRITL